MDKKVKVIESSTLSTKYEKRYVVVDAETDKILDDAQGYGYKTIRNAYAAYSYKNRDKSKDKEKRAKIKQIQQWLKEHKVFSEMLECVSFEIAKGAGYPNEKFDAKLVKKLLKENDLNPDFTAGELLKVWLKWE